MYKMSKKSFAGRCALFPAFVIAWIPYALFHYLAIVSEKISDTSESAMDKIEAFANNKFPINE